MKAVNGQHVHLVFHVDNATNATKVQASVSTYDTGERLFETEWVSFIDEIEYKQAITEVGLKAYHWMERNQDKENANNV
jgi:hypothetical protein